jgi:hypothetical protein
VPTSRKIVRCLRSRKVNINNPDALIFAIRDEEEYKTRFAANAARAKKGLAELDPASYLALENQYRQLLQSNGLPPGFTTDDDFTALLQATYHHKNYKPVCNKVFELYKMLTLRLNVRCKNFMA